MVADEIAQLTLPEEARTLGAALRWARRSRRITLRALASTLGVSAPYVVDVEHDRRSLAEDKLQVAASTLGVPLDELERRRGLTRDLVEWIGRDQDLVAMLRAARASGRRLQLVAELPGRIKAV